MISSLRRDYLDNKLEEAHFHGNVLDLGGKKISKRGRFRPPLENITSWEYLNINKETSPDYCCLAENIPVENSFFDIVLATEVMEHLEHPDAVIKECCRVLKDGGRFIITMPFLYSAHADPDDYQRWTPSKFHSILRQNGFKVEKIEAMGGVFAVIFDLIYCSFNVASNNPGALKNRIANKFLLPGLKMFFGAMDKICTCRREKITTGYYVEAAKVT